MIFALVAVAVVLGFVLVALAGQRPVRGAPGPSPMGLAPEDAWLAGLGPGDLEKLLVMLFGEMKLDVERHASGERAVDLWASNPAPITGVRVYVRGLVPPPLGLVGDEEVRAAIETARAEQAGKAIVVTAGGFTPQARAAASGASADLVDGPALAKLVGKHLPQVAAERHV